MTMYTAMVYVPGQPPEAESAKFDTPGAAWAHLRDGRRRAEDDAEDWGPDNGLQWSDTYYHLDDAARFPEVACTWLDADGTGLMYGPTPGYSGPDQSSHYDQGLAYSVTRDGQ